MRIALILATGPDDLGGMDPLGLGAIGAYVHQNSPFLQADIFSDVEKLIQAKPDLAGISCSTQNYGYAIEFGKMIKDQLAIPVVVGGPHITLMPKSLHEVFDAGVIGEGERTFTELAFYFAGKGGALNDIKGICYRINDDIVITDKRPQIEDLDTLPMPLRPGVRKGTGAAHMVTSRGCPYNCGFCACGRIWKGYRRRSEDKVAEEMSTLLDEYGMKDIYLYDDVFIADRKRFEGFVDIALERKLTERARLTLTARANLLDFKTCERIGRLGVKEVTFGAESLDDSVLTLAKPEADRRQNQSALNALAKAEIPATVSMIIGFPGQSEESIRDTYRFLAQNMLAGKLHGAEVHLLSPFPGTEYYDLALKKGLIPGEIDWRVFGTPWRGLLLNENIELMAAELAGYDYTMRNIFRVTRGPKVCVVYCEENIGRLNIIKKKGDFAAVWGISEKENFQSTGDNKSGVGVLSNDDTLELMKKIGDTPIVIIRQNKRPKLRAIQGALVRFAVSGCRPVSQIDMDVASADQIVECGGFKNLAEIVLTDFLWHDPIGILTPEKAPYTGSARDVFDAHAHWINRTSGVAW